jgi:chromosome partitioning protein
MVNRTFVFHSYKGGTGKTTIAANLAVIYAQRGKKVCMLDFDFRAPSLHFMFGIKPKNGTWLNDFLNGKCNIADVLYEVNVHGDGKLAVGFANPSSDAMWEITRKERKWWAKILRHLLDTKRTLLRDSGFDYLVFDTSPGVQDSSMNALAISDVIVLTLKGDELDVEGTKELMRFHQKLGRRTSMVLNRILFQPYELVSSEQEENLLEKVHEEFEFPVLGIIPCFCDLLIDGSHVLYALKKPSHPFVKKVSAIANSIEEL